MVYIYIMEAAMIKICSRHVLIGLVLLGGTVGMTGVYSTLAQADPLSGDYIITSGLMQGTFSIDSTTHLFTDWDLVFPPDPADGILTFAVADCCADASVGTATSSTISFLDPVNPFLYTFTVFDSLDYRFIILVDSVDLSHGTGQVLATQSVAEGPSFALLMIGLLILAGARWWTHRQQGLQRG
jgi:hypothetical protein